MPNTHRRRDATQLSSWVASAVLPCVLCTQFATNLNKSANSEVELRRVGAVNTAVGSRDPVVIQCAIEVGYKWRHIGVIVEKVINIDQNSRSQTAMESGLFSFQIVDRIRRQSSWASCELCSHRRCPRDSTRQLRRVCVGGVCIGYNGGILSPVLFAIIYVDSLISELRQSGHGL